MAPEQALGNNAQVTAVTDVYGLGAVLYQLLTGRTPFVGGTTYETIKLLLDTEPRQPRLLNPKIDRDLSTICLKCLEKDPKRRYTSALALAQDLEHWLKHEPIQAHRSGIFTLGRKWVRRNPTIAVMAALLLILAVPLGVMVWKNEIEQPPLPQSPPPEKSIAVLPFTNLSTEPENIFFADGVQDEILTDLSRIADLKVTSHASVMHYKSGSARNLREIGRQLGVAHVVEGSVQRSGNRVRVNAQLLDARTDRHLWAQTYDRNLADVFAIQSEIAKSIADQLQAKLSPSEKSVIERPPTRDVTAFNLYSRAKALLPASTLSSHLKDDLLQAIALLNQAVARDPSFVAAYGDLASAHDLLYIFGIDHTPQRLALAEVAVNAALRLQSDSGEAHLALAQHLLQGKLDYDHARAEIVAALRLLPNSSRAFELAGYVDRRQGRWDDSAHNMKRAIELDPHNLLVLYQLSLTYRQLRRYPDMAAILDRALAINPKDVQSRLARAQIEYFWHADSRPFHAAIDAILSDDPTAGPIIADNWLHLAFFERDPVAASRALAVLPGNNLRLIFGIYVPRGFAQGLMARVAGDLPGARASFITARARQEEAARAQPDYAPAICVLGLIDAALGRKEDALREGRRAVDLMPVTRDALTGSEVLSYFAGICTWVGEKDLALKQLATAIELPGPLSYGYLKLHLLWDPLRGDPRFEKLVEEAKQPVALK
jgi:TolB-like protein/Tfp pilus assembly protein PilF